MGSLLADLDKLDENIDIAICGGYDSYQILAGFQRCERAFRAVAQLKEPGRQAPVEDGEQLARKTLRALTPQRRVQILRRGFHIPLAGGCEEPKNRASRGNAAQRVLGSFRLSGGRRRRGRDRNLRRKQRYQKSCQ